MSYLTESLDLLLQSSEPGGPTGIGIALHILLITHGSISYLSVTLLHVRQKLFFNTTCTGSQACSTKPDLSMTISYAERYNLAQLGSPQRPCATTSKCQAQLESL